MLHVIATPIGNLGDVSERARETLRSAALVACEDTRRTWQLLSHLGVPRPEMISYRQGNEERLVDRIVEAVKAGKEVALCSDGGYPGISDPGYRLIRACACADVPYDVIPGPSAVNHVLMHTALSDRDRQVYRAYALNGEDIAEVSKRFGISRNSVSQIKTRVDRRIVAAGREMVENAGF